MAINIFQEKEALTEGSTLIPHGTVLVLKISTKGIDQKQGSDKKYMQWELTPKDSLYSSSKISEFLALGGSYDPRAIEIAKTWMMYALEHNRKAHETKKYDIESYKDFDGMEIVAKAKVIADSWTDARTGETKHSLKNKIASFATPRPDSKTKAIYDAVLSGTQPWQTDELPLLPSAGVSAHNQAKQNGYQPDSYGHVDQDVPF